MNPTLRLMTHVVQDFDHYHLPKNCFWPRSFHVVMLSHISLLCFCFPSSHTENNTSFNNRRPTNSQSILTGPPCLADFQSLVLAARCHVRSFPHGWKGYCIILFASDQCVWCEVWNVQNLFSCSFSSELQLLLYTLKSIVWILSLSNLGWNVTDYMYSSTLLQHNFELLVL